MPSMPAAKIELAAPAVKIELAVPAVKIQLAEPESQSSSASKRDRVNHDHLVMTIMQNIKPSDVAKAGQFFDPANRDSIKSFFNKIHDKCIADFPPTVAGLQVAFDQVDKNLLRAISKITSKHAKEYFRRHAVALHQIWSNAARNSREAKKPKQITAKKEKAVKQEKFDEEDQDEDEENEEGEEEEGKEHDECIDEETIALAISEVAKDELPKCREPLHEPGQRQDHQNLWDKLEEQEKKDAKESLLKSKCLEVATQAAAAVEKKKPSTTNDHDEYSYYSYYSDEEEEELPAKTQPASDGKSKASQIADAVEKALQVSPVDPLAQDEPRKKAKPQDPLQKDEPTKTNAKRKAKDEQTIAPASNAKKQKKVREPTEYMIFMQSKLNDETFEPDMAYKERFAAAVKLWPKKVYETGCSKCRGNSDGCRKCRPERFK